MVNAKELVNDLVSTKKVMVFSKTYCPFCTEAKKLLNSYNLAADKMHVLELDSYDDSIQDYLEELTGARTVPRIFINGKCVGGCSDIKKLHASNELKPLLEAAGALA